MKTLMKKMRSFLKEEDGVTAIEYGLIAALIAVFIIGALQLVGGSLSNIFTNISTTLDSSSAS